MSDNQEQTHEELNDQLLVRREKMTSMLESDSVNPFDAGFTRTHYSVDIVSEFDHLTKEELSEAEKINVKVAGRMVSKRGKGKAGFAHIQDMKGRIQLYVRKDMIGEESYDWYKQADLGDIVGVEGYLFKTNTGELSVRATSFTPLTKALRPLPDKYHGLANVEQRYRQRYLDLISNDESRERFVNR